jgi:hypothetical protein
MDWIDVAEDRDQWRALLSMLKNLQTALNVGKFLNSQMTGSFSRRAQAYGISYN